MENLINDKVKDALGDLDAKIQADHLKIIAFELSAIRQILEYVYFGPPPEQEQQADDE